MLIRRYKAEILALREEISFLKGEAGEGDVLTPADLATLKTQVASYVNDPDPRSMLNIGSMGLTKIKVCATLSISHCHHCDHCENLSINHVECL